MLGMDELKSRSWWETLEGGVKDLLEQSTLLLEVVVDWKEKFTDYSFIVFPAAKGYEGFLKKVFLDRAYITDEDYYGKHFRIGKALNPSLEPNFRNESVYDKIIADTRDRELANRMWETWRSCRNLVFHWFPNEKNAITFDEARNKVKEIIDTMEEVSIKCKIK